MKLETNSPRREPVSVVCVFNKADVLNDCLQRSVEAKRHEAPDIEVVAVDNTAGQFSSAAAALNHGASLARHDYLAFAHQDVYLHSLAALEAAAGQLADDPQIGVIGSVGIASDGRILGRMRDRVVLLGEALTEPTDVDSLDEVLFLIPRAVLDRRPLAERPELAWHAYAVEYGLRLRKEGLRVTAGDIPITHNSLTINLDRLDVAHRDVGDAYPEMLPVRTTCGVIRPPRRTIRGSGLLRSHRWRYRWLRDSLATRPLRSVLHESTFVLSDITHDIDDALAIAEPVSVMNHSGAVPFADESSGPLELSRIGRRISVHSVRSGRLAEVVDDRAADETTLITNLDAGVLRSLASALPARPRVVGFHGGQYWVLIGPAADNLPARWRDRRTRPLPLAASRR